MGAPLAQGVRKGFAEEVTFGPRPLGHEPGLWRHGERVSLAEGTANAKALRWEWTW